MSKILHERKRKYHNKNLFYQGIIPSLFENVPVGPFLSITNILKTLEKKMYIKREIPEGNEREKRLYMTDEGIKVVKEIQKIFLELENIMSSSLDIIESKNLKEELKKISENFK